MKKNKKEKAQVKVVTTRKQARAIDRVAKARNVSKQFLIREALATATGVEANDEFLRFPYGMVRNGFDDYNARRTEAKRKREEASGS